MKIRTALLATISIVLFIMSLSGSAYAGPATLKEVQNGYFAAFPKSDGNKPIKEAFENFFLKPRWSKNRWGDPVFEGIGNLNNRRVMFNINFIRNIHNNKFIDIEIININGKPAFIWGNPNAPMLGQIRINASDLIYTIYMSDANLR